MVVQKKERWVTTNWPGHHFKPGVRPAWRFHRRTNWPHHQRRPHILPGQHRRQSRTVKLLARWRVGLHTI